MMQTGNGEFLAANSKVEGTCLNFMVALRDQMQLNKTPANAAQIHTKMEEVRQ